MLSRNNSIGEFMKNKWGFINYIISFFILIGAWSLAVYLGDYPEALMPPPQHIAAALMELFVDGRLFLNVLVSLKRFIIGYFLAAIAAIVLGIIFGWYKVLWRIAEPIVLMIKPISPLAWSPFIILWFGIGDAPAIATITMAAFFPVLTATVKSVGNVNSSYIKVAQNFGLSRIQTLTKIVLPASFPYFVQGLHTALNASWIFLVAGELLGTNTGLGYLIIDSRQILRYDLIMAGIVLVAVLGFCFDKLLTRFEKFVADKWGIK